jgi:hypothetical protein
VIRRVIDARIGYVAVGAKVSATRDSVRSSETEKNPSLPDSATIFF